ncbi:arginine--tRNA ligase [Candidatus Woesearchaeota archaeon]|nr:arginine--tRNA ligase [Candidatus Woesearchaeota archaeon]
MKIIIDDVKTGLANALDGKVNVECIELEVPKDIKFGDFAMPCFQLAKQLKLSPQEIAADLAGCSVNSDVIDRFSAVGPYLNIFVNKKFIARKVLNMDFSVRKNTNRNVMVEFVSPNTNKPLHLGHVRNMVIGETVSRVLEFAGNNVVRSCLFNDRGVHICKSMYAYLKWGDSADPDEKSDHFVGKFYVKFAQAAKEDEGLDEKAQELLRKWENEDQETRSVWKKMNKWAFDGFNETFRNMGISFDKFYFESEIYKDAVEIVKRGLKDNVFSEDDKGNVVAKLEDYGISDKIILRSDGTSVYITQDLFLAEQKFKDYNLDESIYVVGSEQNLHFKQLFKILELLGHDYFDKCFHLSYGMVYLPSGKMKSREGIVVDADDIMNNMIDLARREIVKRHQLTEDELSERSKDIGLGALKFHMCKNDPQKDMNFDPEESISFEGETGPYVQYTHARISSILRKTAYDIKVEDDDAIDFSLLDTEDDRKVLNILARFPEVIDDAAENLKPSKICRYLLDLSQAFNDYYHSNKVISEDKKLMNSRLYLLDSVKRALSSSLKILSIKPLEEM